MKVLIADNSDLMLMRLQEKLAAFESLRIVGISCNGFEALDKIIETKPDLAIIDVDMPGLNGFEVLKEIRKINTDLKVVILTLYSSSHYREKAFMLGANYFISKADDFETILPVVSDILGKNTGVN